MSDASARGWTRALVLDNVYWATTDWTYWHHNLEIERCYREEKTHLNGV